MAWLQGFMAEEFTNLPTDGNVVSSCSRGAFWYHCFASSGRSCPKKLQTSVGGKKSEKLESSKMVFFDICSDLRSGEIAEQKHNKFFSHHIPCILNSHSAIYLIPNWDYAAPICWKQAAAALVASSVEAKLSTSIKSSWLCCKHGVT